MALKVSTDVKALISREVRAHCATVANEALKRVRGESSAAPTAVSCRARHRTDRVAFMDAKALILREARVQCATFVNEVLKTKALISREAPAHSATFAIEVLEMMSMVERGGSSAAPTVASCRAKRRTDRVAFMDAKALILQEARVHCATFAIEVLKMM